MKKKFFTVIGLICMCLLYSTSTYAVSSIGSYRTDNGKIDVNVNGEYLYFDVNPTMYQERVMVPMRAIFEKLGATVQWDGNTQTIKATKNNDTIEMVIGNYYIKKNSERISIDVPAMIVNNRTLVPVRAISEALNASVGWFGYDDQIVTISTYPISVSDAINVVKKEYERNGWSYTKIEAKEIIYFTPKNTICYLIRIDHNMMDDDYPISKSYYISVTDGRIVSSAG